MRRGTIWHATHDLETPDGPLPLSHKHTWRRVASNLFQCSECRDLATIYRANAELSRQVVAMATAGVMP